MLSGVLCPASPTSKWRRWVSNPTPRSFALGSSHSFVLRSAHAPRDLGCKFPNRTGNGKGILRLRVPEPVLPHEVFSGLTEPMDPTPPYEQAIAAFKEFLEKQGWSQNIIWRRPDDVVFRIGRSKVVRHRPPREATEWGLRYYDLGYNRGLGISLHAECEIGGAAYATIFWTTDDREAESRMMPTHGLKMSAAVPRTTGKSVSWPEWWFWRMKLVIQHRLIRAAQKR